ncbi:S8 family serine peptidase [Candidatus Symbiopectobacterium sp. NZEC127]|uniref:S8 family serine peptidase n=1 Tax=Candidatus Symbiopectobacterium sp. NZEC127 TaxID=2820472 RepID=UPI00222670BF|nr:S8 family serine peptidase [Candidatus Symbiopectobacterium sp. NZEC127]MCW2487916.1 S8 family serine peptidase [Candidatus Symbiopectobacterium sp. NZEC127]
MTITLNHYRDYRPSGKIYVFCEGHVEDKKIVYSLYQEGILIQEKKGRGDELLSFDIPDPGTFTLSAKVYSADRPVQELHSGDIVIPPVPLLPPPPPQHFKSLKGYLALVQGVDNYLEVKFYKNGLDKLKNEKEDRVPLYYSLRSQLVFEPRFTRKTISKISKISPVLTQCAYLYKVDPNIPEAQLLALAQEIERLDYVEYCALLSKLVYPPPLDNYEEPNCASSSTPLNTETIDDIAHAQHEGDQPQPFSNTPNFTSRQGYLDPGQGMNVRAAWARNVSGQTIGVHVSDFGVENQHEDLVGSIRVFTNRTGDREHGTATMGAIRANNNNFGVTGIAFNCTANFYDTDVSNLDLIIANFRPGDIVAVNNQIGVAQGILVPMVHSVAFWNRINTLVRSGAVVVFAGGNGGHNLRQLSQFNDLGDSGGIMAGACSSSNGQRLPFSNFNLYLSANSWGENVTTTGYGGLQNPPPVPLRAYTGTYSGTSSATPLLTGAMALIQSYARATYRVVLSSRDMLQVIERSGSRQAQGQGIGVRPNVNEALREVDILLGGTTPPPPPPPPPPGYPAWQLGAQYEVGQRVSYQGLNYQCIQRHRADSPAWTPPRAPTLWRRI